MFALKTNKYLEQDEFDILHVHLPFAANILININRELSSRMVYTAHIGEEHKQVSALYREGPSMELKILVTGGSDFIGHHLTKYLLNRGHQVFNVDIASNKADERVDIRKFEKLKEVFELLKPDVVVHLAATASIPQCEEDVNLCFETNVRGTLNVAMMCHKLGCKLVFASSSAVYGEPLKVPMPVTHPLNPVNVYGLTELLGERIVQYYSPSYVIFRIFNVYGPECYRSYVIPDIIRKILAGYNPILLHGTGEEFRDFIYIEDVLEAFRIAIETPITGVFNLGSGKAYRIRNIATRICDIMGMQGVELKFEGRKRLGDFTMSWADISEGNGLPNWAPRFDIRTGLKVTIDWHLKST